MKNDGSEYVPSGSCAMVCWRLAFDIISASLRELAVRGRLILSARLAAAVVGAGATFSFLLFRPSPWRFLLEPSRRSP